MYLIKKPADQRAFFIYCKLGHLHDLGMFYRFLLSEFELCTVLFYQFEIPLKMSLI